MVAMSIDIAKLNELGINARIEGEELVVPLAEPITVGQETRTEVRFKRPKFTAFEGVNIQLIQNGDVAESGKLLRKFTAWHEPWIKEIPFDEGMKIVSAGIFFAGISSSVHKTAN